jgi:hypothetical protein
VPAGASRNASPAPEGSARIRHFTIRFNSTDRLAEVLDDTPYSEDTSGNSMGLTGLAET